MVRETSASTPMRRPSVRRSAHGSDGERVVRPIDMVRTPFLNLPPFSMPPRARSLSSSASKEADFWLEGLKVRGRRKRRRGRERRGRQRKKRVDGEGEREREEGREKRKVF